jgi:hypothetical protein
MGFQRGGQGGGGGIPGRIAGMTNQVKAQRGALPGNPRAMPPGPGSPASPQAGMMDRQRMMAQGMRGRRPPPNPTGGRTPMRGGMRGGRRGAYR